MTKSVKTPALSGSEKESVKKMKSRVFIVTDQKTGIEKSIEADNELEALRIFRNQPVSEKPQVDLNGDGKFDSKDASIAGKTLSKSKNIKS